jgi:hypothetical protein
MISREYLRQEHHCFEGQRKDGLEIRKGCSRFSLTAGRWLGEVCRICVIMLQIRVTCVLGGIARRMKRRDMNKGVRRGHTGVYQVVSQCRACVHELASRGRYTCRMKAEGKGDADTVMKQYSGECIVSGT